MITGELNAEKGRALVLAGPQGCGKTLLARKIAARCGPHRVISLKDFERDFQNWMDDRIKAVVVEGFPTRPAALKRAEGYAVSDAFEVNRRGRWPETMATPSFIFCTHDVDAVSQLDETLFRVVRMEGCP